MCGNFAKSTLTTYTDSSLTLTTGSNVTFNSNYKLTGSSITHTEGSASININRSGLYLVTFSANGVESETAGDITLQLFRNGVAVPGAVASENSATATDVVNMGASTVIEVDRVCNCYGVGSSSIPLTLVNTGVGATYSNVTITVIKLA